MLRGYWFDLGTGISKFNRHYQWSSDSPGAGGGGDKPTFKAGQFGFGGDYESYPRKYELGFGGSYESYPRKYKLGFGGGYVEVG